MNWIVTIMTFYPLLVHRQLSKLMSVCIKDLC
jgi:hypothetical protein